MSGKQIFAKWILLKLLFKLKNKKKILLGTFAFFSSSLFVHTISFHHPFITSQPHGIFFNRLSGCRDEKTFSASIIFARGMDLGPFNDFSILLKLFVDFHLFKILIFDQ